MNLGLFGYPKQIHDHTGCIQSQRLFNRLFDHSAEQRARQLGSINISDIRPQNQGLLLFAG